MKKVGDLIEASIHISYGRIEVEMLIIDILDKDDNTYLAYAQNRVARIQYKADDKWHILKDIDVVDIC